MLHGRLLRVSEVVEVLGAVEEQERITYLEQQLHRAETAALAAETRVAQLDARKNEARAINLWSVGKLFSMDKPAVSETSDSSSWRAVVPRMLT